MQVREPADHRFRPRADNREDAECTRHVEPSRPASVARNCSTARAGEQRTSVRLLEIR